MKQWGDYFHYRTCAILMSHSMGLHKSIEQSQISNVVTTCEYVRQLGEHLQDFSHLRAHKVDAQHLVCLGVNHHLDEPLTLIVCQ